MTDFDSGASPVLLLEHWKPVAGYEEGYEISNLGRIWSKITNRYRKFTLNSKGYPSLRLSKNCKMKTHMVHKLMMITFVGPPPLKHQVNHIDGIKSNPRLSNLEYTTGLLNMHHSRNIGLRNIRFTETDIRQIKSQVGKQSLNSIARERGVFTSHITQIANGKIWKEIT